MGGQHYYMNSEYSSTQLLGLCSVVQLFSFGRQETNLLRAIFPSAFLVREGEVFADFQTKNLGFRPR